MTKVLLGQLGSNGDCLYATTIARQIKTDFPGCHLIWAISSLCRSVIDNNPDVDEVWEIRTDDWKQVFGSAWYRFERDAWSRVANGEIDYAFLTQIAPNYFSNYDGTIRPSIFRGYPKPITVPIETVIRLTDQEQARVEKWIEESGIRNFAKVVLFECSSKSGQSFITPERAVEIAQKVLAARNDVCFVLSTHLPIAVEQPGIVHGGALSIRETAALTHSVDLFVGCGSGVTVAATSGAAKAALPNIQILNRHGSVYASFKHDFEYFSKSSDHFLETTIDDLDELARAINVTLDDGIAVARERFALELPIEFNWYVSMMKNSLFHQRRYLDAARSLKATMRRYGRRPELLAFGHEILPGLRKFVPGMKHEAPEVVSAFEGELDEFCDTLEQSANSI